MPPKQYETKSGVIMLALAIRGIIMLTLEGKLLAMYSEQDKALKQGGYSNNEVLADVPYSEYSTIRLITENAALFGYACVYNNGVELMYGNGDSPQKDAHKVYVSVNGVAYIKDDETNKYHVIHVNKARYSKYLEHRAMNIIYV